MTNSEIAECLRWANYIAEEEKKAMEKAKEQTK